MWITPCQSGFIGKWSTYDVGMTWIHIPSWWRHQMEIFYKLMPICAVDPPVTSDFPAQRPVTRSFDVFFDLRLNKRSSIQSGGWWLEILSRTLWRHCNGMIMVGPLRGKPPSPVVPLQSTSNVKLFCFLVWFLLSPGRRQAIIWTNTGILLIRSQERNLNETLIEINIFSLKKMHLKIKSGKWRPFYVGLNVLRRDIEGDGTKLECYIYSITELENLGTRANAKYQKIYWNS